MSSQPARRVVRIESESNQKFRQLVLLNASSRERRKQQRSVIEGARALDAFLTLSDQSTGAAARAGTDTPPAQVHEVFVPESSMDNPVTRELLNRHAGPTLVLTPVLFRRVSQMASSQGPVAIIDTPRPALPASLSDEFVYLDRVQDPGNIGTILRTCAAAGVRQVVTSRGTAFCWAPKVLRAAMGAHFALQIYEGVDPARLIEHLDPALSRRALVAPGASESDAEPGAAVTDLHAADLTQPAAWFFGNEGQGLRDSLCRHPSERISISQSAQVESLNVASAVAICLFEARRQRRC